MVEYKLKEYTPALKVLDRMIDTALFMRSFHDRPNQQYNHRMIGELTKSLSSKDREAIQQLKSEEIEDRNSPLIFYKS